MSDNFGSVNQSEFEYLHCRKNKKLYTELLKRFVTWIRKNDDYSKNVFEAIYANEPACPELAKLKELVEQGEVVKPNVGIAQDLLIAALVSYIAGREEADDIEEFEVEIFELGHKVGSVEEGQKIIKQIQYELDKVEDLDQSNWSMKVQEDARGRIILSAVGTAKMSDYEETMAEVTDLVKTAYIKFIMGWINTDAHHREYLIETSYF